MELASGRMVRVTQEEIEEAIMSLVFKKKPELRPSGIDTAEIPPKVYFSVNTTTGVMALVTLESNCEEVAKP